MDANLKNELNDKMDKTINVLDRELSGLRTGRASANLLDPVSVEAYGGRMPLNQVATVSTPDATTISVQIWDKDMSKAVEKAIVEANLGLNPMLDGQMIRINMPPLSEERRVELVKVAHKYGESCKIAIRNIRRDGMDTLKKMEKDNQISEDEHHNHTEEVQKLTDAFTNQVDEHVAAKEQEILKI